MKMMRERIEDALSSIEDLHDLETKAAGENTEMREKIVSLERKLSEFTQKLAQSLESAKKAEKDIIDFTDSFHGFGAESLYFFFLFLLCPEFDHVTDCGGVDVYASLKADLTLLETKLCKSPLIERVLRPDSPSTTLQRSHSARGLMSPVRRSNSTTKMARSTRRLSVGELLADGSSLRRST